MQKNFLCRNESSWMGERSYYEAIIIAMSKHGFLMRREADGFQLINEGQADERKVSQPRSTDLFGITADGTGRFTACEVKLFDRGQTNPRFSDFRISQVSWMNDVEKYGGVSLVCYVHVKEATVYFYGWFGGQFTPLFFKEEV